MIHTPCDTSNGETNVDCVGGEDHESDYAFTSNINECVFHDT